MKIKLLVMIAMFLACASAYAIDIEGSLQKIEQVFTGEQTSRVDSGSCKTECQNVYGSFCGVGSATRRGPPSNSQASSTCYCTTSTNSPCGSVDMYSD